MSFGLIAIIKINCVFIIWICPTEGNHSRIFVYCDIWINCDCNLIRPRRGFAVNSSHVPGKLASIEVCKSIRSTARPSYAIQPIREWSGDN